MTDANRTPILLVFAPVLPVISAVDITFHHIRQRRLSTEHRSYLSAHPAHHHFLTTQRLRIIVV